MTKLATSSVIALFCCAGANAALFSGPSSFTTAPHSQMGAVTNNLVLTDTANGFVVSGQLLINVPAGFVTGVLAAWEVDRPLDATYGTGPMSTTTLLDGFSQPPVGAFGNTFGNVSSTFTNFSGPSLSQIPMSLVAGAAVWSNIIVPGPSFTYTSGGTNFLHQSFFVDGTQLGGPGGIWIVDVPVRTSAIPTPGAAALLVLGGLATGRRRR